MGKIVLEEQATPVTPGTDKVSIYPKAGGGVYKKNDAGTEVQLAEGTYLADVVDDTTPQLGGDLEYHEHNQVFDITLTSDNSAAGNIITVTYGETVAFGQLVYPDATDNEWKLALGTNAAVKHPAMGIALEAKDNGESGKMLLFGTIRDATYFAGVVMGDIIYLSDSVSGGYLTTAPSTSGDIVQIVGFAIAANYIFFNPDYTYVEVA